MGLFATVLATGSKDAVDLGGRVVVELGDRMGISVKRESDAVMPEPLLRDLGMYPGEQQRRRVPVPQRVVMDAEAEALCQSPEVYCDFCRPDAPTVRSGADKRIGCLSYAEAK